jgi:hypothetical protein
MTTAQLVPVLVIPLVAWRLYSRMRRTIGRQPLRRTRLLVGLILFTTIVSAMAWGARHVPAALGGLGGGLALGLALGWIALRLTRFELSAGGGFYTPNTAIGISVTALLVGRIVYRISTTLNVSAAERQTTSLFQSPLTLLIFGITAGYYLTYSAGLLWHARPRTPQG